MSQQQKTETETLGPNEVDLTNIAGIEHLRLPITPGKITVLTGANGCGKTKALEAVDALARGKGRLSSRDGTVNGSAVGFGVRIKVGRGGTNRRTDLGEELHVEAIEDRLSVAELVDPGLKDPIAADARRIRALVNLSETPADVSVFKSIANPLIFQQYVTAETGDLDDLVKMAAAIKRDFERVARMKEDQRTKCLRDAEGARKANEGIDLLGPCIAGALQGVLEEAIIERELRRSERELGLKLISQADEAREKIERVVPVPLDQLRENAEAAVTVLDAVKAEVRALRKNLDLAKAALVIEEQRDNHAHEQLALGLSHAATLQQWQESIDKAAAVEPPTPHEVAVADIAVTTARQAVEDGTRIRDAQLREVDALRSDTLATDFEREAESLRDSARATEDVLTIIVAEMGGPFKVDEQFRLIVTHAARGECYFAELSEGERWRLGLDAAIAAFERHGTRGLLVIPQGAYESLDGRNRKLLADHIAGTDLAVLTAVADLKDDPSAEVEVSVYE